MKIYLIKFNHCDYDQYDGFVVIAQNRNLAIQVLSSEEYKDNVDWEAGYTIKSIKPSEYKDTTMLLDSFHAG